MIRGAPFGLRAVRTMMNNEPQLKNLLKDHLGPDQILSCSISDVVYLPKRLAKPFIKYSDLWRIYGVHTEVAIVNILFLTLLEGDAVGNWDTIRIRMVWDQERDYFNTLHASLLTDDWSGYHPIKIGDDFRYGTNCKRHVLNNVFWDCL